MTPTLRPLPLWLTLIISLVLIALIGFAGFRIFVFLKDHQPEARTFVRSEKATVVDTIAVKIADHQPRILTFGQLQSSDQLELKSAVAGRVIDVAANFSDGSMLSKGDLVLKIDPFDYQNAIYQVEANFAETKARIAENEARVAQERATIEHADEQKVLAARDYERIESLHRRGNTSDRALDDGRNRLAQAEAAKTKSKLQLGIYAAQREQLSAKLKSLALDRARAERNLADTELRAPFDALVSDVNVSKGRQLTTNDRIATLVSAGEMDVQFTLSDRQYGRLVNSSVPLIGREVDVLWGEGTAQRTFKARVERVSSTVDAKKGSVDLIAKIEDLPKNALFLRVGAFVEVALDDQLYKQVFRLPRTSVYDRERVYRINKDKRLEAVTIEVVGLDGDFLLVRGKGLQNGDPVTTNRLSTAGEGLLVRLKSDPPPQRGKAGQRGKSGQRGKKGKAAREGRKGKAQSGKPPKKP